LFATDHISRSRKPRSGQPRGPRALPLLASLIVLLGACSSVGLGFGGDRLLVRLYDGKNQLRLQLSNQSNPDLEDVYSREQPDASLKLAPDQLMEELIADLDKLNFQTLSAPGEPPKAGARGWVEIHKNGSSRTFVVPEVGANAEQLTSFAYMKLAVNEYYTHVGSAQFIKNQQGGALLKNQQPGGGK